MRILAFTDVHGDLSTLERIKKIGKEEDVDLIVFAGDYTFFEDHIGLLTRKLSELGTNVLLIHGNHEYDETVYVLCKKYKNMHFMHNRAKKIGKYIFIGYGGGGFAQHDPEFAKTMRALVKNIKNEEIVLITHAPPYKTKVDLMPRHGHVGNIDYRRFIEKNNVVLHICGHLHERFGVTDKIGKTVVVNPGYKGKIIELK
jgi:hypothetical protein